MAVLLEHGSHSSSQVAMFPFHDSTDPNYAQPRTSPPIISSLTGDQQSVEDYLLNAPMYGLDGAGDGSLDNPFSRSKINSQKFTQLNCSMSGQARSAVPEQYLSGSTDEDSVGIDSDPAFGRRKRRRISPDGEHEAAPKITTDHRSRRGNLLSQQTEIESYAEGDFSKESVNSGQDTGLVISPSAEVPTPDGQPRQPESLRATVSTGKDVAILDAVSDSTFPKTKRSTPRKNLISIHSNGKLMSSPAACLSVSEKVKPINDKKAKSGKNYKMKNGRFVQTLEVALHYGYDEKTRQEMGNRINSILSSHRRSDAAQHQQNGSSSKTHPFFTGKLQPKPRTNEELQPPGDNTDNETDTSTRRQEPVAWKDIKFSKPKSGMYKTVDVLQPIWPPLSMQHVGIQLPLLTQQFLKRRGQNQVKMKAKPIQLKEQEDVFAKFAEDLKAECSTKPMIELPKRIRSTGKAVDQALIRTVTSSPVPEAVSSLRSALISGTSAFDRGECAGPYPWSSQYAPASWSEVLQPSASVLHQWLQGLVIHNVKSGIGKQGSVKNQRRPLKKKRRLLKDDFDDFIVNSDDDEVRKSNKTAILITGPNGCGKTAAVFAVAKELGYEVFEIHPGMRRSAKDIFDKVGDMAHNHLVQKGADLSRSSSVAPSDPGTPVETNSNAKQVSVTNFLGPNAATRPKAMENTLVHRGKKEQKQSLILFEEVDILFDEDKGFWTGVQSLIDHSKRPVILTCNDLDSVPLDDLDLHDVLTFTAPDKEVVTDYLMYLTAAEGHIIDREALQFLYESKGNDLRASITELNLWCQMTVGSTQGGLDWMTQSGSDKGKTDHCGDAVRVFSKGTYFKALDLVPQAATDSEMAIRFAQDVLGIAASEWCDPMNTDYISDGAGPTSHVEVLSQLSSAAEARSIVDVFDPVAGPTLSAAMLKHNHVLGSTYDRHAIANSCLGQFTAFSPTRKSVVDSLAPVMIEKSVFPPSQGRLAPSIDAGTAGTVLDVAPYVRSIVSYDMRVESQRHEVFGSQETTRRTRAARAAIEGGDKASTRSERWFPKDLNFMKVLSTGGLWPQSYAEQLKQKTEFERASPSILPEE